MTILHQPPAEPPPRPRHDVALWAGAAAFFASLLTIGAIDILNPSDLVSLLGSTIVALITALAVYSKQRLTDAKDHTG